MGCQSEVYIGNNLTFTVNTHDPETSEYADADFAPVYRVYQDTTTLALGAGSMAKLDDSNTKGFYAATIACTAANGFVAGHSYAVYIEATVDGHPGTISYNFVAKADPSVSLSLSNLSALSGTTMTLSITASYAATLGGLTIPATWTKMWWSIKDSSNDADNLAVLQVVVSNPAVAATDGVLYVAAAAATVAQRTLGSLVVDATAGTVAISLTAALTAALPPGERLSWDLKYRESGGAVQVLTSGAASCVRTVTWAL